MKILIVAMSDSIHTARWISQIADQGWDIHLCPSTGDSLHTDICGVTFHPIFFCGRVGNRISKIGVSIIRDVIIFFFSIVKKIMAKWHPLTLIDVIANIRPDIVHSLEMQHAGYQVLEAKKTFKGKFPPWIVTNWGSDIYLFGRLAAHAIKIREVLSRCDYYSCECNRDVCLGQAYGFEGTVLPVFPNTGGFNIENIKQLRQTGPVSARRLIMLKGYQHFAGRALVGLRALERCSDLLAGYEVAIYCSVHDVILAAELFSFSTGIPTRIIPHHSPHDEILRLHGQARISLGLSISDAISTSLLEAMVMGSFPIQSWTACADEWIEYGKNGMLVPPEDPDVIEKSLRLALTDDCLVDAAAAYNERLMQERLDSQKLKKMAVEFYRIVAKENGIAI